MTCRRAVKITVDAALYGLMLALMSYPLTRGLLRHGVCGMAFVVLLLVHQSLNLRWYRTLFRGRWNARRVLLTGTDTLLLISSTALVASSLAMAGEVFSFMSFPMIWWGRGLHSVATAWTFVLVAFHLVMHGNDLWNNTQYILGRLYPVAMLALCTLGATLFVRSGLWNDMLMMGIPKPHLASLPLFLAHYAGITLFFCLIARGLWFITGKNIPANREEIQGAS